LDDAGGIDLAVWHQGLLELEDLAFVAQTLLSPPPLDGIHSHLSKVVSGAATPKHEETKHSPARDFQFELLLAAIFRASGLPVTLREPDIVVALDHQEIGVAAKRPRSREKLGKNLRQAEKQISRAGGKGLIALDLSCLINFSLGYIPAPTFALANEQVVSSIDRFVRVNRARMEREAQPKHSFGLIAYFGAPVLDQSVPRLATVRRCVIAAFGDVSREEQEVLWRLYKTVEPVLAG
jgi:hypothetical protein